MLSTRVRALSFLMLNSMNCHFVFAAELMLPPGFITHSTIDSSITGADKNNYGVLTVNIASGEQNNQVNQGSFALNFQDGAAKATINIHQAIENNQLIVPNEATAQIVNNSFNNSAGWIAVNQASGLANAQINTFSYSEGKQAISNTVTTQSTTGAFKPLDVLPVINSLAATELGISGESLADNALQETLSGEQPPIDGGVLRAQRAISVEDTAFRGASGLVQLNQSAGSGNRSVNNFALRIVVDAKL